MITLTSVAHEMCMRKLFSVSCLYTFGTVHIFFEQADTMFVISKKV